MNLLKLWSKLLVAVLALSLVFPVNPVCAEADVAKTRMKHAAPDTYIPGFRIQLNADIKDDEGIREARCYFKAKDEIEFAFVDMQSPDAGAFEAVLPAPELNSKAVNYFFLSLNGKSKVARSQVFEIVEQDTSGGKELKEAEQAKASGKEIDLDNLKDRMLEKVEKDYKARIKKHQIIRNDQVVKVKTETSGMSNKVPKFKDNLTTQQVSPDARYGLAKSNVATVTATSGGAGLGWVIGGLALVGAGAAAAGGGGGGGGGSSSGAGLPGGTGEVKVTLQWPASDCIDLDLHVIDPCSNEIYFLSTNASCQGHSGVLDIDSNAGQGSCSSSPVENIFWTTAPTGTYTVRVNHFAGTVGKSYTLSTIVNGSLRTFSGTIAPGQTQTVTSFAR